MERGGGRVRLRQTRGGVYQMAGWLFDFCENRDGIVIRLKKDKCDYGNCRNRIKGKEQLAVIDSFFALEFSEAWRNRTHRKRRTV
jgi:hypothetical protein